MKKMLAAAAMAVTAIGGMVAAMPTAAEAQPYGYGPGYNYGRPYYGRPGPRYRAWRRGYHQHFGRYPTRVCRTGPRGVTRCFYR